MTTFAKTTRPTLAGTIERPRLFRRLDRARCPVIWVAAPPGAGKTALVTSWLARRRQRVLWYQVDAGDDDVAAFFYHLGRAAPGRRPLPLLTAEYRPRLAAFARRFFRELYRRLGASFTLVLDNYQEAPLAALLHEVMREALEEIPPGGRVIVLSRGEPPPSLARLVAHRAIERIGWPELRFTAAEANGLARRMAPDALTAAAVRALHARADGWCAGLILLIDQAKGDQSASRSADEPVSELLFDYFAGEIFARASPEAQEVLLKTAFVPEVTAAMADALAGQSGAGDILARLHRQNYFTTKQAGPPPTYRYHPLFRAFLLAEAARRHAPEALRATRRTAAKLLDSAGRIEAAAELLRDAQDWEGLARLIHVHATTLFAQGRAQTVEHWLDDLPPAIFDHVPWLLLWRGMGWLGWRHAECERALELAFQAFRRRGDALGMYLAGSNLVFAYVSEGESQAFDRWITQLDEITREFPGFPTKGTETRVSVAMMAALVSRQPWHPQVAAWAARANELASGHPDLTIRSFAAMVWLIHQWQLADFSGVDALAEEMRALMLAPDASPVVVMNAGMSVAWHEAAKALPSYRASVGKMLDLTRTTGMFYTARHVVLSAGIMAALGNDDLTSAASWLEALGEDVDRLGAGFRFWHRWLLVWDALMRGDQRQAASRRAEMQRLAEAGGRPVDLAVAHLLSAQVCLAKRDVAEAGEELRRAAGVTARIGSDYFRFMTGLVEAQLCFATDRKSQGLHALAAALLIGRERGYVHSHVWLPKVMAELCVRALAAGIEVGYARELIRRRRLVPEQPPLAIAVWPWPLQVLTLGRFEVRRDDVPPAGSRKVPRKPLAVLKLLIAQGGRAVREEVVMDALWPDADGDAARQALTVALHRLRRLLGLDAAVVRRGGRLGLDTTLCWVDAWAVDQVLGRVEVAGSDPADLERALALYHGTFLDGDQDELPHARVFAERLRRRLLRQVIRAAERCEGTDLAGVTAWLEAGLRIDACAEDVYRRLMAINLRLGRPSAAVAAYERCRAALAERHAKPSVETDKLLAHTRPVAG
jgi:ATP/maltotriose-dependent transcriptional regulator MalT/DNA-binding SARP family transcriptional activator